MTVLAVHVLNFDESLYRSPGQGFYNGSLAEFLRWRFIDHEALNPQPTAEASGEARAAGVDGMSLGERGAT